MKTIASMAKSKVFEFLKMFNYTTTVRSACNKGIISNKIQRGAGIEVTWETTGPERLRVGVQSGAVHGPLKSISNAWSGKVYDITSTAVWCLWASWPAGHAGQSYGKNFLIAVGVRSGCMFTMEELVTIESIVDKDGCPNNSWKKNELSDACW